MPHRIISLVASATEIVDALGCTHLLVGRSHECDFPPQVVSLPACSEAKFNVHGTSQEIDDRVKAVLADATSVYRVFSDELNRLAPTVVITQTQCEVCAVSLKDVEAALCDVITSRPTLVACEPNSLADVWADFLRIASALDIPERGVQLVEHCERKLAYLREHTAELPMPTIACIEWIEPLMAAGNWVPELVEIAGGHNLFGTAGAHSPWMTWDDLIEANPDVIAIMSCGFDMARIRAETHLLTSRPAWADLAAVKNGRVFVTDGNQYFNRPGPRLVESAEILAELLHPKVFQFGHQGTGWQAL